MAKFVVEIRSWSGYNIQVIDANNASEAEEKLSKNKRLMNIFEPCSFVATLFKEAALKARLQQLNDEWKYHDTGNCSCNDDNYQGRPFAEHSGTGENCSAAFLIGTVLMDDMESAIEAVTADALTTEQ